ncbi:MAG: BlaI/MecI/CopY family transcriptional regulator [Planctomycetota bacterium]|jgi:predicted transcriptional regulator
MPRKKTRTLTELELRIMQVVWQHGEVSVQGVQETLKKQGKPLALPSIRTMLSILQDKGYVARRRDGRAHLYTAKIARGDAQKRILRDIVKRAFRGSAAGLVAALVEADLVGDDELEDIRRLIEEREGVAK